MVIDKTLYLCPSSPGCSVAAFALPFSYQGQGKESCWMEKILPLVGRGCPPPITSVMAFQGAGPALLWQICAVEVFYGGILWDGL